MAAEGDCLQNNSLPESDILDAIQEGIWVTDKHHRIVFFNAAMEVISGACAADVLGLRVTKDFPPETMQEFLPYYFEAVDGLKPVEYMSHVTTPAGRKTVQAGWLTPRSDAGNFNGMICSIRDITIQQQLAEQRSLAAREWETTFDSVHDAMWILDSQHHILQCNRAAEELFSIPRDQQIGRLCWTIVHGTTEPISECPLMHARTSLQRESMELQIGDRWFLVIVDPILNDKGLYNGAVHVLSDITQQTKVGAELKNSEKRFRMLAEFAPMSLYETDALGKCVYANALWLEQAGLRLEDALGDGWQGGLHEEDRERILRLWEQHATAGTPWSMEYRFRTPAGKTTWVQGSAIALRDDQGRITGYLGANLDITERKNVEAALSQSLSNLSSLVENTEGLIWSVDRDYRMIVGNTAFQERIRLARGRPFTPGEAVLADEFEDSRDNWRRYYDRALAGERFHIELPLKYGETLRDFLYHFTPIHDTEGRIVGATVYGHDTTDRNEIERNLAEREEQYRLLFENMLDAFALHEIILDAEGLPVDYVFIEVNEAFERLTGLSREALIGNRVTVAIPGTERDPADWIGVYGNVALTGNETRFEQYSEAIGKWFSVVAFSPRPAQFATVFEDITQRRADSAALQQSEMLLRTVAENYPDSYVSIIEKDLTCSFSSGQEFKKQGLDSDQFQGASIDQVFGEHADVVREHYLRTFEGEEQAFELFTNEQHQSYRTVPLLQADGSIPRILAVVQNITEKKIAEQALRESEAFNRVLLDMSPDLIYIYDLVEKSNVYSNEGLVRVLGYSPDEIKAMGSQVISALMHPEDFDIYLHKTIQRYASARDGDVIEHEYRMRHKDGAWRWLHSKESIFSRLSDGSPKQIFGLVSDVTQSKSAEQALQDERDRAQQYLDIAGVIILALSTNGEVSMINQRGSEILGYEQEEILGTNWLEIFVPEALREETANVFQKMMAGEVSPVEYHENPIVTRSGEERTIAWHNAILRDAEGDIIGSLSSGNDITEQLRAEQEKMGIEAQLRQSQKLESIGTLASGVAHEINNPLMGMINYAELVKDRVSDDVRSTDMLKGIIDEGGRITTIVKDLLSFARQDDAEQRPAMIEDIIEETLSLLRAALKRDQIALSVDIEKDLSIVPCRSQQIRQVLVNLITNAQDALNQRYPEYDENKILSLSARSYCDNGRCWVRISVEDHGTGIPEDIQDRIYDPFFTSKTRDQGTGLGLSVSHGIVKEHSGRMSFETQAGVFTCFHVDLPILNKASE